MIYIGYQETEKREIIRRYCTDNDILKTVVISANKFPLHINGADIVTYSDTIEYVTFYRLLQEIDSNTLVVLHECLRTQNRYELHYNCIRNFLNQTEHCIVFQYLPQIDKRDDFMILFDFVTGSRWKHRGWDIDLILSNAKVFVRPLPIVFDSVEITTSEKTKERYIKEKEKRFRELGLRDPHTIPRNLYLIGGRDKLSYIKDVQLPLFQNNGNMYVARNNRLNHPSITVYRMSEPINCRYGIVEFPHRFIDFLDFMRHVNQTQFKVLISELKVDKWYFERYRKWSERINETYTSLQQ